MLCLIEGEYVRWIGYEDDVHWSNAHTGSPFTRLFPATDVAELTGALRTLMKLARDLAATGDYASVDLSEFDTLLARFEEAS